MAVEHWLAAECGMLYIQKHINIFFEINNGTAEQVYIWDSFKAYIRGVLIKQAAFIKKQDN